MALLTKYYEVDVLGVEVEPTQPLKPQHNSSVEAVRPQIHRMIDGYLTTYTVGDTENLFTTFLNDLNFIKIKWHICNNALPFLLD